MKKKYLFTVLMFVSAVGLSAQENADSLGVFIADGWIEKMDRYASYKLALTNDIEAFSVDTETNDIELFPNTTSMLRFSFNYAFISISAKFGPEFLPGNGDTKEKGKTNTFTIGTDFTFRHWVQSFNYTATKGYYLNNTKDYDPSWQEGDPYIQFPEMYYFSVQGTTAYSFNPKFSVKSLTTQTERQRKSAGTFLPVLSYRYYILNNKEDLSATVTSTQKSDIFEMTIGIGYYHTFVVAKDFYFSLGASPGVGYLFMKLTTRTAAEDYVSRQQDPIYRLEGRSVLGYNGLRFFSGLSVGFNSAAYEQGDSHVINSDARAFYQLHVGYRFQAPKKLRETVSYVEDAPKKKK